MTEQERIRRIYRVACLAGEGMSTREISKFLSENEFSISNATVADYINRLQKINPAMYETIKPIIDKNKPKTIKNSEEVQERVKKVIEYLLKGLTIDEVAIIMNEKPLTIYRDLRRRVQTLSTDEMEKLGFGEVEIEIINQFMSEHSKENLRKNKSA